MSQLWDIAIATTQGTINQGLGLAYKAGLLPTTFSQTVDEQGPYGTIYMELNGTFGAPTIAPDSVASQTLQVTLPVLTGTVAGEGGTDPVSIDGMDVVVTLNLQTVTSAVQPAVGTNYDLVINFADQQVVQSVALTNVPTGVSGSMIPTIQSGMEDWLNQTEGQTYTVATVTLGNTAANAPYLVPSLMAYTFAEADNSSTDDANPFAVLMLTDNQTDEPTQLQVPPNLIPTGQDFGAQISNEILMSDIVVQGLAAALGTSASSFTVSGGGSYGEGQTVSLKSSVTVSGKGNPVVSNLSAQVSGNALQLSMDVSAEEYGITATYKGITASFEIQVTEAQGGSQSIQFASNGYNLPSPSVSYEWWAYALFILLGGLTGIISILLPLVEAAIEALILVIVQSLLPSGSQSSESGFNVVLAQVQWNYTELVNIADVSLPTPIQISGTLPILNVP